MSETEPMTPTDWQVLDLPLHITKGMRLRVARSGEPDMFVIVDSVERDGDTVKMTVHPEGVETEPGLLRYYGGDES